MNIGNRQQGRLNAGNVNFVKYDKDEIKAALKKACLDEEYRKFVRNIESPFGDDQAPQKIKQILKDIDPSDPKWLVKSKLC